MRLPIPGIRSGGHQTPQLAARFTHRAGNRLEAKIDHLADSGRTRFDPASPDDAAYLEFVNELVGAREPIRPTDLHEEVARLDQLRSASRSFESLTDQLRVAEHFPDSATPLNAPYQHAWRREQLRDLQVAKGALEQLRGDPELDPTVLPRLKKIERELAVSLTQLEGAGLPKRPAAALRAHDVAEPGQAAAHLARLLDDDAVAASARAALAQATGAERAKLEANLGAFALLSDAALHTPSYAQTGMGWHYPDSRTSYRAREWQPWSMLVSDERVQASRVELVRTLTRALESPRPSEAMERALVTTFLDEIGVDPNVARGWKPRPEAVREALQSEALTPLRALNETVDEMAPHAPHVRPQLRQVVDQVIRHVVEGDFRKWRYENPTSARQLAALSDEQRATWMRGLQVRGKKLEHLTTREEDGVDLLWLTKIGGPSHGFDYGGQCLLPLLTNARTKAIVVEDARSPQHPSARAYLRMLNVEGQPPRLYLEPLQRDFLHRGEFRSAAEDAQFQRLILRHAAAKAKKMGLALSIDPALEPLARQLGLVGRLSQDQYVLEPSGGVFEASDTLSHKHDWVQTEREVTNPLTRWVIEP